MKTIVVLGVGLVNALVVRQLMRTKVLPSKDYKMVVISPNAHFHWAPGMVRAIVPGQFTDEKVLIPLEPIFKSTRPTSSSSSSAKPAACSPTATPS